MATATATFAGGVKRRESQPKKYINIASDGMVVMKIGYSGTIDKSSYFAQLFSNKRTFMCVFLRLNPNCIYIIFTRTASIDYKCAMFLY